MAVPFENSGCSRGVLCWLPASGLRWLVRGLTSRVAATRLLNLPMPAALRNDGAAWAEAEEWGRGMGMGPGFCPTIGPVPDRHPGLWRDSVANPAVTGAPCCRLFPWPEPVRTAASCFNHGMAPAWALVFLINGRASSTAGSIHEFQLARHEEGNCCERRGHGSPFCHVHVKPVFAVNSVANGNPDPIRAWKDVVFSRAGETVRIRTRFDDFTDSPSTTAISLITRTGVDGPGIAVVTSITPRTMFIAMKGIDPRRGSR